MEVESTVISLLKSIDIQTLHNLLGLAPSIVGAFSMSSDTQADICLSLFKNILLLRDRTKSFYSIDLTFDVKLEIIYFKDKKVTSQIIGFSFHSDTAQSVSFYGSDSPQFAQILSKILNMRGFHQMFRPIRKLGRGNFATVYEAERNTDLQRFAVKAFSKQHSYCSKNGKASLMNELSLLRSLNIQPHPNVLHLEAVYQSQNSIYVVLELLEGQTLLETLKNGMMLSPNETKKIMIGLLKGVAHICKSRVMHRDLKPQNIMIRKDSFEPVIVDFGLATNVDLSEYLFFRCGTPGYVAPQIIQLTQSIHLQPTCDMFSLGAIFHLLLTGRALFPGTKYEQVYRANKVMDISFEAVISSKVKQYPRDLLIKMLIMAPSQRITAEAALNHSYFTEIQQEPSFAAESQGLKSPTLTAVSDNVSQKKKKKKKFFFF